MVMQLIQGPWVARRAPIVDAMTLVRRFALSGDYIFEKLGGRFYRQAGTSVSVQELVSIVQNALAEEAKSVPPFMTSVIQDRASDVAGMLVDDPDVQAAAAEAFDEVAKAQRACGTSTTVEQTTEDLYAWAAEG
ncbi:MAG TPA: hypothetical protein VI248_21175 [Kineosporiaceae bacterium]